MAREWRVRRSAAARRWVLGQARDAASPFFPQARPIFFPVSSSSDSFPFFLASGVSLGEGDALGFFFGFDDFFFDGVVDLVGEGEASSSCWVLRNASRFRFSSSVSCACPRVP